MCTLQPTKCIKYLLFKILNLLLVLHSSFNNVCGSNVIAFVSEWKMPSKKFFSMNMESEMELESVLKII